MNTILLSLRQHISLNTCHTKNLQTAESNCHTHTNYMNPWILNSTHQLTESPNPWNRIRNKRFYFSIECFVVFTIHWFKFLSSEIIYWFTEMNFVCLHWGNVSLRQSFYLHCIDFICFFEHFHWENWFLFSFSMSLIVLNEVVPCSWFSGW